LLPGITWGAAIWLLGGCGWHHNRKPNSYDRAITDDSRDPTYHPDEERVGTDLNTGR